jgi:hypothetical protein
MMTCGHSEYGAHSSASSRIGAAKPDDFVSVARRLECDEDKRRFEAKLAKIAKAKRA